jgi:hypothetical protein
LDKFLATYPNGAHAGAAQTKLQDLVWNNTKQDDIAALEAYVKRFPSSAHSADAARRVDDLRWNKVEKKDSGAVSGFMRQYPDSAHRTEAQTILDQLSAQNAPPPSMPSPDKRAVLDALGFFNVAFDHQKVGELKEVWPTSNPYLALLGPQAGNSRTIFNLHPVSDPVITGSAAQVLCDLTSTVTMMGKTTESTKRINVSLYKNGRRWLIKSFGTP